MIKTRIALFILLLSINIKSYGQWETIHTGNYTTIPTINSIYFKDFNNGIGAGNGLIIKTTNSGINWDTALFSQQWQFKEIVSTKDKVFAVGFDGQNGKGLIARSKDNGIIWDSTIVTDLLYSVFFSSDSIGYCVGADGTILKTLDAGSNWNYQNSGVTDWLRSVFFINDSIGFVSGSNILKTTDSGVTWVNTTPSVTNTAFTNLFFPSDSIGYCLSNDSNLSSDYTIYKTVNGGNKWNIHSVIPKFLTLSSMFFTNDSIGYIAGQFRIIKTTDGATTWTDQASGPPSTGNFDDDLMDVFFINNDTGFAAGPGQFYKLMGLKSSINETLLEGSRIINIYPNPFIGYATFSIEPKIINESYSFELFDILGKQVRSLKGLTTNQFQISSDGLKEGIYFYKIHNSWEIIAIGKLVIK